MHRHVKSEQEGVELLYGFANSGRQYRSDRADKKMRRGQKTRHIINVFKIYNFIFELLVGPLVRWLVGWLVAWH